MMKNKMYLSLVVMIGLLFGLGGCGAGYFSNKEVTYYKDGNNDITRLTLYNDQAVKEYDIVTNTQDGIFMSSVGGNAVRLWKINNSLETSVELKFFDTKSAELYSDNGYLKYISYKYDDFDMVPSGIPAMPYLSGRSTTIKIGKVDESLFSKEEELYTKKYYGTCNLNSFTIDSLGNTLLTGNYDYQNLNKMFIHKVDTNGNIVLLGGDDTILETSASIGSKIMSDVDNNIYVAGVKNNQLTIWKYSPSGILDNSFGSNGIATYNATPTSTVQKAILKDNAIYIIGSVNDKMAIWKYNIYSGTLDVSFGTSGVATFASTKSSVGNAITYDSKTNKLYVVGSMKHQFDTSTNAVDKDAMMIWRYNLNGTLDTSFSDNGYYMFEPTKSNEYASDISGNSIVVDSKGSIFVAGHTSGNHLAVWKYEFYNDTTAPVFTSNATVSVNENQTSALTLTATDASSVTYSISGGDSSLFNIDSSTGVVTFKTAPDYETKTSYTFTATATDAKNNVSTQTITININDVAEAPSITHNGVSYQFVTSPLTGEIWLDKNLGASQVCTSATDIACFGDYYQWGRSSDGHEKSTATTTATQATTITSVGNQFITVIAGDWTTADSDGALRSANWSKTDGTSICPSGFRVPTLVELQAEFPDSSYKSYSSFLKIPASKVRSKDGSMYDGMGGYSALWASDAVSGNHANRIYFYGTDVSMADGLNDKASGYSIRCIKN